MKLEQLQTFCAIVESGNLEDAARRVFLTQPAVSQQLRALEDEFGHRLYERRAGRATPPGERLYLRAKELLRAGEELRREMREYDEGAEPLSIGASDTNAQYFLPPFIREFGKTYPGTPMSIVCRPSGQIAQMVADGEIDVGIVTFPVKVESLVEAALDEQRLLLITPRRHALFGRSRVEIGRLKDEAFVLLDSETQTGEAIENFFEDVAMPPNVVLRTGSFEVIKRYVAEGIGVSFVPERVLTPAERKTLGMVRVAGLPTLTIGAVWRATGYSPVGARRFLQVLGVREDGKDTNDHRTTKR